MNITAKKKTTDQLFHTKKTMQHFTAYFREVLTDFDEERYPSDIKKILNWYNLLQAKED
jgi:hypothetical protein